MNAIFAAKDLFQNQIVQGIRTNRASNNEYLFDIA